jgi:hypothetical protein
VICEGDESVLELGDIEAEVKKKMSYLPMSDIEGVSIYNGNIIWSDHGVFV